MADDKNKIAGWLDALDEGTSDAPAGDHVKSAVAINPNLVREKQQAELMRELESAQKSDKDILAGLAGADITKTIFSLEQRFRTERAALRQKIARAQQQATELPQKTLDKVITAILTHDPNMAAPKTLTALQQKKGFLDLIGFSARKVIDRQMQDEKRR